MRSRALAVMASLFLASLPAAGQTPEELAHARTWFTQGTAYERNGAWEKALERFERALAVKQTPQLYLHMGYCREQLNQLLEALEAYSRARELAREQKLIDALRVAQERSKALEPRIPKLTIVVPADAKNPRVWVDDVAFSSDALADPISINPGPHSVRATAEGARSFRRSLNLGVGESRRVELELEAPPKKPVPVPPSEAPAWPGFVLLGAGIAGLGAGVALLVLAIHEDGEIDDRCGGPERLACPESERATIVSDIERVKGLQVGSGILGGAGLVAVAVGTWLLATREDDAPAGAWWILPSVGEGEAGLHAGVRF